MNNSKVVVCRHAPVARAGCEKLNKHKSALLPFTRLSSSEGKSTLPHAGEVPSALDLIIDTDQSCLEVSIDLVFRTLGARGRADLTRKRGQLITEAAKAKKR
jgi:hypothetical protein